MTVSSLDNYIKKQESAGEFAAFTKKALSALIHGEPLIETFQGDLEQVVRVIKYLDHILSSSSLTHRLNLKNCEGIVMDDLIMDLFLMVGVETLASLNLSGSIYLHSPFLHLRKKMDQLVELDLSHCIRIQDHGVQHILLMAPNLTHINLSCCYKITNDMALSMAECLPKLISLDISGCTQINDIGLSPLFKKRARDMTLLNISGLCDVSGTAFTSLEEEDKNWEKLVDFKCIGCLLLTNEAIRNVLMHSITKNLKVLHLAGIRRIDESIFKSVSEAQKKFSLQDLNVSGCFQMGLELLEIIHEKMVSLKQLRIDACPRISKPVLTEFKKHHTNIQVDDKERLFFGLDLGLTNNGQRQMNSLARYLGLFLVGLGFVIILTVQVLEILSLRFWIILLSSLFGGLLLYFAVAFMLVILGSGF